MNGSCALTTFDNPFDPFEQFSDWFRYDVDQGYYSCAYLARIAKTSEQFSDEENNQELQALSAQLSDFFFLNYYFVLLSSNSNFYVNISKNILYSTDT